MRNTGSMSQQACWEVIVCYLWLSFDPVHKIVPAFVIGKINQEKADLLLQKTKRLIMALYVSFSAISVPTIRRRS